MLADTDTVTAPEGNEQSNLVLDNYDCAFTSLEGSGNMRPMTSHRSEFDAIHFSLRKLEI